jgi:hypothetical protein
MRALKNLNFVTTLSALKVMHAGDQFHVSSQCSREALGSDSISATKAKLIVFIWLWGGLPTTPMLPSALIAFPAKNSRFLDWAT